MLHCIKPTLGVKKVLFFGRFSDKTNSFYALVFFFFSRELILGAWIQGKRSEGGNTQSNT
jgi:hypothetical protein